MQLRTPALQLELSSKRIADQEDWCRVWVTAQTPAFQGEFEGWLQSADLARFAEELDSMQVNVGKACTATLSSAEPDIHLELKMQTLGGVSGAFALRPDPQAGGTTSLSGTFEVDQSYLGPLLASVRALCTVLRGGSAA